MSAEIISFLPSRIVQDGNTQDAWEEYMAASQRVRDEHPNVNIPTLRACIDAYERFCFLLTRDGGDAA